MKLLELFKMLSLIPSNTEKLRGLILELAIQGKLTQKWRDENPNLEPAAELLSRVKFKKQELVSEKKIKPEKPSEIINDEDKPFKTPLTWRWSRLQDLALINGGFAFKSSNYKDKGARVIRISDFNESGFKDDRIVRHPFTEDLSSFVLEKNNILIAMTGGTVGKSLFVESVPEIMVVNQRVATIKIVNEINEAYINCVIPCNHIQNLIEEAKNSTNDNISMGDIKAFLIPTPPVEEQKAIVETVKELLHEVEQLEALSQQRIKLKENFVESALGKLTSSEDTSQEWNYLTPHLKTFFTEKKSVKSLRETILQLAVQGKLTKKWREENPNVEPASELIERIKKEKQQLIKEKKSKKEKLLPSIEASEIPYEIPISWEWERLNNVTKLITKGSSPKWQGIQYVNESDGGVLFITSENVGNYNLILKKKKFVEVKFNDIEPRSILRKNDILMNIVGGSIGRTAIYNLEEIANINQAVTIIRLVDNQDHNYFLHFFNSPVCKSYMYDKQVDNARPNLSMGNIAKFVIPIPPLEEQKAIVEKVNSLMALCDELEKQIINSEKQIEQLMKSCLKEALEI